MESALYDPEKGFYSRRVKKADFYTAPELTPAFGAVLSRALAIRLDELKGPCAVVEMGSGDGTLSRQVRAGALKERPDTSFILVERTRPELLASVDRGTLGFTKLEDVPPFRGVLYSNELVDAFPMHVLESKGGRMQELYVDAAGRPALGALSRRELEAVDVDLAEGERHAVNLEADRWMALAAEKLVEGFIVTIDYGKRFNPGEVNAPRSYMTHATGDELVADAGLRDLTASVDFERLVSVGRRHGLEPISYTTLSRFLIDHGIADELPAGDDAGAFKARAKIKTLLHPDGMGEIFKVLIQRKVTGK
jgi:SAM-dependent MidA family methyltransferase